MRSCQQVKKVSANKIPFSGAHKVTLKWDPVELKLVWWYSLEIM